jgi:hypothetical protein
MSTDRLANQENPVTRISYHTDSYSNSDQIAKSFRYTTQNAAGIAQKTIAKDMAMAMIDDATKYSFPRIWLTLPQAS